MTICELCKHRTCLRSGKPCKKIEKQLPKNRSGQYKEKSHTNEHIEEIAIKRAIKLKYGQKTPIRYDDELNTF